MLNNLMVISECPRLTLALLTSLPSVLTRVNRAPQHKTLLSQTTLSDSESLLSNVVKLTSILVLLTFPVLSYLLEGQGCSFL